MSNLIARTISAVSLTVATAALVLSGSSSSAAAAEPQPGRHGPAVTVLDGGAEWG